jgi:hypothetical protein
MDDDLVTNTSSYNTTDFENARNTMRTYIQRLISSASSPTSNLTWVDPLSNQSRALEWIVSDQLSTDPILTESRILQRFALATLFFSTSGANWTNSTEWLTSSHECDWYHPQTNYVCDENGLMHTLQMDENGLTGTLPPELAIITSLRTYAGKCLSAWSCSRLFLILFSHHRRYLPAGQQY